MKNKIINILLISCLVLSSLTGCGKKEETKIAEPIQQEQIETQKEEIKEEPKETKVEEKIEEEIKEEQIQKYNIGDLVEYKDIILPLIPTKDYEAVIKMGDPTIQTITITFGNKDEDNNYIGLSMTLEDESVDSYMIKKDGIEYFVSDGSSAEETISKACLIDESLEEEGVTVTEESSITNPLDEFDLNEISSCTYAGQEDDLNIFEVDQKIKDEYKIINYYLNNDFSKIIKLVFTQDGYNMELYFNDFSFDKFDSKLNGDLDNISKSGAVMELMSPMFIFMFSSLGDAMSNMTIEAPIPDDAIYDDINDVYVCKNDNYQEYNVYKLNDSNGYICLSFTEDMEYTGYSAIDYKATDEEKDDLIIQATESINNIFN